MQTIATAFNATQFKSKTIWNDSGGSNSSPEAVGLYKSCKDAVTVQLNKERDTRLECQV